MTSLQKKFILWFGIILLLSIISILILPWLFTLPAPKVLRSFDEKSSNVSNTISGIATPFIAIGAAILTYLAFWIQFKANEKQRKDIAIERFESMFFEMIRFHRDNVSIINNHDNTSRNDLFITMFFELRFIYNLAINIVLAKEGEPLFLEKDLSAIRKEEIFNIAYIVFFSGANPDTKATLNEIFKLSKFQETLFNELIIQLKEIRKEYRYLKPYINLILPKLTEHKEYNLKETVLENNRGKFYSFTKSNDHFSLFLENKEDTNRPIIFWILKEPFEGHTNELGHYFEHLLQSVKYIDSHEGIFIEESQNTQKSYVHPVQYNYLKMLRAQLSNYEMLLLYYHSLSTFGNEWLKKTNGISLLAKYNLLKKMPFTYADFYREPKDVFKVEIENGWFKFEWHKHRRNMNDLAKMHEAQ